MSIVMKFGGTSVQDANAMRRVARIIRRHADESPLIVISALAGVTQSLIDATHMASFGRKQNAFSVIARMAARHFEIAEELLDNSKSMIAFLRSAFREIRELLESISILQEVTPRSLDRISGYGELLSSCLLDAYLQQCRMESVWLDARKILITDNSFGSARPLPFLCLQRSQQVLLPTLHQKAIPVLQGYIGGTLDGIPTTLGRGASDTSAAIFGNLLNVDEIQIWTDVCGILTADPKIDRTADTIPNLTYARAAEMSERGARVLHLEAIAWAQQKNIPIRVLNTFEPNHPGTIIAEPAAVFAVNNSRNLSAACE